MTTAPPPGEDAPDLTEASEWFARLRTRSVSAETLDAFRDWRLTPGNRQAYAEVESAWARTAKLDGHPDIAQSVRDAMARGEERQASRRKSRLPTTLLVAALALGGLTAATLAVWPSVMGRGYSTEVGEQRVVTLADGSRLRLDTATRLTVKLSNHERLVRLQTGQAFFDVAHDAARPFVVQADDTRVQALGTRFDVRRDPAGVRVTLVQGKVRVDDGAASVSSGVVLAPGEQVVAGARLGPARRVDVAAATSWTSGRILFHQAPLRAAVAEVNRYSPRQVVLASDHVGDFLVTGGFDSGDVDAFVEAVCELHDLKAVADGKRILLRDAAAAPNG